MMTLTRWEPFRDLLTLSDRMNRMFNDPAFRVMAPAEPVSGWFPPVDIHEESDRIVLRAEIPHMCHHNTPLPDDCIAPFQYVARAQPPEPPGERLRSLSNLFETVMCMQGD